MDHSLPKGPLPQVLSIHSRYQLDNGNTRYERAYWIPVGKELVLAKKGYYSVPLPNSQYSTVFYTADHRGYHVDMREFPIKSGSSLNSLPNLLKFFEIVDTLSAEQPTLPKNLEVPGAPRDKDPETKQNIMPESEHKEQDVRGDELEDTNEEKDIGHVPTTELYVRFLNILYPYLKLIVDRIFHNINYRSQIIQNDRFQYHYPFLRQTTFR